MFFIPCYFGGVAQLGERLTGSKEVVGSSPIVSIKIKKTTLRKLDMKQFISLSEGCFFVVS